MSILNNPVLVLNKDYVPVHINTVREAMVKICLCVADAIDPDDYSRFDWDTWISIPVKDGQEYIKTVRDRVLAPKIIVLNHYNKIPFCDIRLTRRNIFIRDDFRCQYSGRKLRFCDATVDHVVPASIGGKTTWNNLVTCCRNINISKGNKTLEESGLTLLNNPKKPGWSPLFCSTIHAIPESWYNFLSNKTKS